MRRLASLLLVLSFTGCFSGIDQKPYDVHIGPHIDSGDAAVLIVLMLATALVSGAVRVATDR
jgi:hypothetical protein